MQLRTQVAEPEFDVFTLKYTINRLVRGQDRSVTAY